MCAKANIKAVPMTEGQNPVAWALAGPDQAGELAAFAAMAFDPYYREAWSSSQISGLLTSSGGWAVSGRDHQGAMMAFALNRMVIDEVELLLCAIHPAIRGKGVGRQLMEQVREEAVGRGCRLLFLEVRDGNLPALALYRTMGFSLSGSRPDYYTTMDGKRIDALTLNLAMG